MYLTEMTRLTDLSKTNAERRCICGQSGDKHQGEKRTELQHYVRTSRNNLTAWKATLGIRRC